MTIKQLRKKLIDLYEVKLVIMGNSRGASAVEEVRQKAKVEAELLESIISEINK